jgi:hypothetical protein
MEYFEGIPGILQALKDGSVGKLVQVKELG